MPHVKLPTKSEETDARILESALDLLREQGFDAAKPGVATGAAYDYYPSKDAIVMDFYRRSSAEMQPRIAVALENATGLEYRLCVLIQVKIAHFSPNRGVLRALLRNGADPKHPLSRFSPQTAEIRDLEPHLPGVLWFFQMGVIYFPVIDESSGQTRTARFEECHRSDPDIRAAVYAADT